MNAPFNPDALAVTLADLDDPAELSALELFVRSRPDSTPFHRPAWIKAVATGTGQKAHYLVARDAAGAIRGVLPLTEIRSWLFGRALVSSGFAVGGGMLADGDHVAETLAQACWTLAESLGCTTAELRGGPAPAGGWVTKSKTYMGFRKPLETDDEAQLQAVPRKHRAELRKGLANNLQFEIGRDRRLRDIHYALFARSVHNLGTPVFPRTLFEAVLDGFGEDADIAVVFHHGKPVSSILSLYHGAACMPYWQGSSTSARALRSNEVAYFRLMSLARERGYRLFDFGRSKGGTGPAAWKKSWGWEGEPLSYHVRAAEGHELRDVNPLSPQYQRKVELWRKLPLGLANCIGPHIARGLG
ncbi:FemAB family XrtA/PEP-CTERM system-associated protein [Rhizorhapis sp.]|uniref:FemAB family XrtA/PEP-CTERM system-associated protein n=1 Tax=Rhizorhapis sp. TaxID=1968842 RepID=UPI002B488AF7|nr:FemAB family XrtA/PEP-CTERM system-associated protein [Rhizorhapis sp.]HKR16786.1 FemAB family XrtA/PEP-CTERM system-associated protein [Rhizorhapis sp.]